MHKQTKKTLPTEFILKHGYLEMKTGIKNKPAKYFNFEV